MDKFALTFLCLLGTQPVSGFEKLDSKYQIQYRNPNAPVKVVEYFSMRCRKCFDFFQEDFPEIKKKYVDGGEVFWASHPDPADLLTLQAMVCLESLHEQQKPLFFEAVMKHIQDKKHKHGDIVMQAVMEVLGHPLPKLSDFEFLETTSAFKEAFLFLKQEDVVKAIPVVEINGTLLKSYPTREIVEKEIKHLTRKAS